MDELFGLLIRETEMFTYPRQERHCDNCLLLIETGYSIHLRNNNDINPVLPLTGQ